MMDSKYYAMHTARHLAKTTLQKFVDAWASNRTPEKKGKKQESKFLFFDTQVTVSIDEEGEKRINGHLVKDFWRKINERHAKQILCEKPYLVKGLCEWPDLWEVLYID